MQIQGVSQTVETRLREEIMTGVISPGERINEIGVSERFGVSRPPLREALRRLESENLIVSIPRRGSYVTKTSREDCVQIYRARIMLELGAIDIISEQGGCTPECLRRALEGEKRLHSQSGVSRDKNPHSNFIIMSQFHNALVEACGNSWVIHYHNQLRPTLGRYQIMYLNIPGESIHSREEHDRIFDLVASGDYQVAKDSLRAHIERTMGVLVGNIPEK